MSKNPFKSSYRSGDVGRVSATHGQPSITSSFPGSFGPSPPNAGFPPHAASSTACLKNKPLYFGHLRHNLFRFMAAETTSAWTSEVGTPQLDSTNSVGSGTISRGKKKTRGSRGGRQPSQSRRSESGSVSQKDYSRWDKRRESDGLSPVDVLVE